MSQFYSNNGQSVTYENLFHSNLTHLPPYTYMNISHPQTQMKINNRCNIDYAQRSKEEKFNEKLMNQKNYRFNKIYQNKINRIDLDNNVYSNKDEVFIDDYISKIKEKLNNINEYYNYTIQNGYYNFSICPFCGQPAVYAIDRVICINKCFMTIVGSDIFDENYTLDNFMEQYKNYYSNHMQCADDLYTLYVDKESKCAEFICNKCEKNF